MPSRHDAGWDGIYHRRRPECLPWELGEPRKALVELVNSGRVRPCKALDICCGIGTNPLFLAERGFDVTALDISDRAVRYAKERSHKANLNMNVLIGSFLLLPFKRETFDFVFDFGCFHHVEPSNRSAFIAGIDKALKLEGLYFLACFSYQNGPAWNHFTKAMVTDLFGETFKISQIRHVSSVEADKVTRYFYEVLMQKRA